jgi:hypothetical protein
MRVNLPPFIEMAPPILAELPINEQFVSTTLACEEITLFEEDKNPVKIVFVAVKLFNEALTPKLYKVKLDNVKDPLKLNPIPLKETMVFSGFVPLIVTLFV